jgi:F-type H+-transporting ATPase subunit a
MLHISIAAEKLWILWGFPITNSLLTTWIVMIVLAVFAISSTRKMSMVPGTMQNIAEMIIGGLYDFFASIAGPKVKQFFTLVATFFLFILVSNWLGLLPGVGTIGFFHEQPASAVEHKETAEVAPPAPVDEHAVPRADDHVTVSSGAAATVHEEKEDKHAATADHKPAFTPLFRAATADLNTTIVLALVAVIAMQYFGFVNVGAHYAKRFFDFKDPIMFSVGLLEVVSDMSKVLSFAFRLFGNIFAGEVLLAVMAFLMPFIVPLPFLAMELFVGIIQAVVFSMLATAFFSIAVSHGESEHGEGVSAHG